jgi:ATP/maltotriose-dependent transcriptional regulator MalT
VEQHAESALADGGAALDAGNWSAARAAFELAAERERSAEALLGLGEALWWLGDVAASVRHREAAYAAFRRRDEAAAAAAVAVRLSLTYRANLGNRAAAAGWLARAERLVADRGLAQLEGWVALVRAGADADPAAAERLAREALAAARAGPDPDLELCALSQIGSCLMARGRVDEGVALLDEAMAGSLGGEGRSLHTVVFTSCQMIISCSRAADYERAGEWIRAADDFAGRYGCPFLFTVCRTVYGGVLYATGRWARAEEELRTALTLTTPAQRTLRGEALARLADLRIAQGRLEEAERLLQGFEDHPAAALPRARIHLAAGEPGEAAAALRRVAGAADAGRAEIAPAAELLVEAELALGESGAAALRARRLAALGDARRSDPVAAHGHRALGRVTAAAGDGGAACRHLERALEAFRRIDAPMEAALTRLRLAEALDARDPAAAIAEARAALAALDELGADGHASAAAAFLRDRGAPAGRPARRRDALGTLSPRELDVLRLLAEGLSNREIAARLVVTRKTVEHHVARVLAKLGLRSRAEAAAYAARSLGGESSLD